MIGNVCLILHCLSLSICTLWNIESGTYGNVSWMKWKTMILDVAWKQNMNRKETVLMLTPFIAKIMQLLVKSSIMKLDKFELFNFCVTNNQKCCLSEHMELIKVLWTKFLLFKDYAWWEWRFFGFSLLECVLCIEFTNTMILYSVF